MADNKSLDIRAITEVANILTFRVRANRVLVKPADRDTPKTSGGILIPEATAERMLAQGTVVRAGTQVQDLKAGDTVFFYRNTSEGAVRQGNDLYFWFQDYNIIADLDTPPLQVLPDGEIQG
jgi:co-chaperonin GroES (HSP10)